MNGEEKMFAIYDKIIRPEMRSSWNENYKTWFVTSDEPEDVRFPGKLKTEFEFTHGRFIALMPKTYFGLNYDDNEHKMGSKGKIQTTTIVNFLTQVYHITWNLN